MTKTLDDNTFATNPGKITISHKKLRLLHPDLYGLPVSVRDYGQVGTARFQRSTMQVWAQDLPFAPAGTALPGNSGELARAAGLWPSGADIPSGPPAS